MRIILFLLRKEFRQILRNRVLLPIMFVLPILQLLILVPASNFEVKSVNLGVVNYDASSTAQKLINQFAGSAFFHIRYQSKNLAEAEEELANNGVDMLLIIPADFEKKLLREKAGSIQLIPNAINANFATLAYAYAAQSVYDFNRRIVVEWARVVPPANASNIAIQTRYWFNPELKYDWYMYPGIMVVLITMIGIFLTGLNLVREKEIGTGEQLNVTPLKKHHFILGKLIPFLIIGLVEFLFATLLGRIIFNVPLQGNLFLLVGFAFLYLLVVLGIGLLISTLADTQQQMMFVAFFVIIIFILLSGIFTPVESMPVWVQQINRLNPIAYIMRVIRMVMLKGSGFKDLHREAIILATYAIIVLSLATIRYKKTS